MRTVIEHLQDITAVFVLIGAMWVIITIAERKAEYEVNKSIKKARDLLKTNQDER